MSRWLPASFRASGLFPAALMTSACLLMSGCGDSGSEPGQAQATANNASSSDSTPQPLPTASIPATSDVQQNSEPEEGTPKWLLAEIKSIRTSGLESVAGAEVDLEKLRQARRERNERIITLATEAIKQTHEDPAQLNEFNEAIRQLLEARVQLAFQGQKDDIEALYADVESLRQRDPQSKAAAEATHSLLMFTNTNAGRFGATDARWLEEFVRMAVLFATDYPGDPRAVGTLFAAGLSCDLHGQREQAEQAFGTLVSEFKDSPQAQQAMAILRRLRLIGKPLELAGPTLTGGFVDIEELRGRFALVVFWASDNPQFQSAAPELVKLTEKYSKYMRAIGVCLDEDESAIDSFLEQTTLPFNHIFDPNHRRWDNQVVKYYGVRNIPQYWIVDHRGNVVAMTADAGQIEKLLVDELRKVRQQQNTASE